MRDGEEYGYQFQPNTQGIHGSHRADDRERGLYEKYRVIERADGQSAEGEKHHGCEYFVLDLTHDKFAEVAIRTYAKACMREYPELARDLVMKADEMERRNG